LILKSREIRVIQVSTYKNNEAYIFFFGYKNNEAYE